MKTLIALLTMTTCAFAEMPPKDMDLGNETMSEKEVIAIYRDTFSHFGDLTLLRVPFGQAQELCLKLSDGPWSAMPTYGCQIDDIIIYSIDSRLLAWSQGRHYDPLMANHVLRHEFAHRFFNWSNKHERALP